MEGRQKSNELIPVKKGGASMIRFRLLDAYGQIVDHIDLIFSGLSIHEVRKIVDHNYGHLRQYGMRLVLTHV